LAATALLGVGGVAQGIILYQNDFETPSEEPPADLGVYCPDISVSTVNFLYGPEFQQTNTVETIAINGPGNQYDDPSEIGGDYALGMLCCVEDDKAALTFDSQGKLFLNLQMDISPIDANGCGGPFGVEQPTFRLTLYDTPGGVWDFNAPGTVLSSVDLVGNSPIDPYTFNWKNVVGSLSTAGSVNGTVTVVWDLLPGSGYASFDNLVIAVSDTPGDVSACPDSPQSCRSAEKSLLLIKDDNDNTKDKLIWKWIKGLQTSQAEFGDPVNSADYTLCLYAGTAATFLAGASVPAVASKWSEIPGKGYKYKDKAGTASGVQKIVLKGSTENKAKALVKGKGGGLPDVTLGSLPLPLTTQLVNTDNSVCFEGTYGSGDVIKNDATQFKAKAQQP
jgi:hypothetical protein